MYIYEPFRAETFKKSTCNDIKFSCHALHVIT